MILIIVGISTVFILTGYIARGFGYNAPEPTTISEPSPPQGGIVQSVLGPIKWVYDNSIGALFDVVNSIPSGMPAIIIGIITSIISLLIVLYLIELARGKG